MRYSRYNASTSHEKGTGINIFGCNLFIYISILFLFRGLISLLSPQFFFFPFINASLFFVMVGSDQSTTYLITT